MAPHTWPSAASRYEIQRNLVTFIDAAVDEHRNEEVRGVEFKQNRYLEAYQMGSSALYTMLLVDQHTREAEEIDAEAVNMSKYKNGAHYEDEQARQAHRDFVAALPDFKRSWSFVDECYREHIWNFARYLRTAVKKERFQGARLNAVASDLWQAISGIVKKHEEAEKEKQEEKRRAARRDDGDVTMI